MSKIFKNMIPYRKSVVIILCLLFVQAWCDLALPDYTSDIIDVGIQNHGVEHILPEAVTAEEYELAQILMTEEEVQIWEDSYEENVEGYLRKDMSDEELSSLDETLLVPILMNYQMSAMEENAFRELIAAQTGADAQMLGAMSIEEIGATLGMTLETFEQEKENEDGETYTAVCLDMRHIFKEMEERGDVDKAVLLQTRESLEVTLEAMGSSLLQSMGVAYAISCDEAAGISIEKLQTAYLWKAGLKMLGIALIMGIVTVLVGFFASRVGAGIGRDLRDRIFKRVVCFSNAEMDHFSTASLITRSTNDIQQIQMVSGMLLRMVAYAPILGIGGVIKVMQTGANMEWIIALALLVILGYVAVLMSVALPKFKLMQKLVDGINLVSREILTGLSVIRAFGREERKANFTPTIF